METAVGMRDFLLGRGAAPSGGTLRRGPLAAWTYSVLPAEHADRAHLRPDFLASLARHHEIRRELIPLLRAWREAGVDVVIFKGFHLAEWVYPAPGTRLHGDVDLLVRPEFEEMAIEIARRLGWEEEGNSRLDGRPWFQDICSLKKGATEIDLHRYAVHTRIPLVGPQARITSALWDASRVVEWEGTTIRLPDPVDALLVGLVLQRSWGEQWRLKAHDVLDFRMLLEREGVRMSAVRARARALGCTRTLEIFLSRCDPEAGCLELEHPGRARRLAWSLLVLRERPFVGLDIHLARLLRTPAALLDVAAAMPVLLRVRRALRQHQDLRELLGEITPPNVPLADASPSPGSSLPVERARKRKLRRTVRGIRWGAKLVGEHRRGDCLLRSLALFRTLRAEGLPVVFVSGVKREGEVIVGHAWVEVQGRVLHALREADNRNRYEVNFSYPEPEPEPEPESGPEPEPSP